MRTQINTPLVQRPFAAAAAAALLAASVLMAGCTGNEKTAQGEAPYGASADSAAATTPSAVADSEKSHSTAAAPTSEAPTTDAPAVAPHSEGGATAPAGGAGAPPSTGGAPPMGGMFGGGGDPMAPLTPTPEMDEKITTAEKGSDKKTIAAAYADRGYFRMTDDNAGQRVKYRAALDDFRKALAADPTNAKALENKEMIESIYRSMGRPVPGEEEKPADKAAGKEKPGKSPAAKPG